MKKLILLLLPLIFLTPVLADSGDAAAASGGVLVTFFAWLFVVGIICFSFAIPMMSLLGFVLNVVLIFDVFKRNFGEKQENQQVLWIVVLLLGGFPIGTILYYLLVMKKIPKRT